mmetsp:Transcript_20579/g.64289  ORF Transcript_20579/g.64289 Transcript_20579/m.64289 type:complete len:503 (-) Transcript_20579:5-1513(-)
MRLPMKPKQLPASTAFLPSFLPIAITVASVSPEDADPRTFSSSGMILAGEKKCVPHTSCGREVAEAILSMSSVDVFVQSSAPGLAIASSSLKMAFFSSSRSKTASTYRSAVEQAGSSSEVAVVMHRIRAPSLSSLSLPFATFASYAARIPPMRVSSASGDLSTSVTGIPLLAKHIAIPPPIVPAPMTAADSIGRGGASTPTTFEICRSAKKTCCSARASGPAASCAKSSLSRERPASKEGASAAARTASTMSSGASSPLAALRAPSLAAPKKASTPPSTSRGRADTTREGSTPSASASANPTAASATPSPSTAATTSSARPSLAASAAPSGAPLVMILIAGAQPMRRGSRCVPPAPGSSPRWTSGSPHFAALDMTRQWQASATSSPPPSAVPCIAATVGIEALSSRSITSPSVGWVRWPPVANSAMSAPAGKVMPSPARTSAFAPAFSACAMPSTMPLRTARPSALTGGLEILRRPTLPMSLKVAIWGRPGPRAGPTSCVRS